MVDQSTSKLVQKRVYDILSHRYGLIIVLCSCILLMVSAFQFGEALLEWSEEKYATVFNSFSDNIAGRSYRKRLCLPVPIDVVYTWVNGSDPSLMYELRQYKEVVEVEINQTSKQHSEGCHFANCVPSKFVIVDPSFPPALGKETISILYPEFKDVQRMFSLKNPADQNATVSVLQFESIQLVQAALKADVKIAGANVTVKQAYYTTDWTIPNSVLLQDKVLLMGFPDTMGEDELRTRLPKKYIQIIEKVEVHSEKGIAILTISNKEEMDKFLEEGNVTIDGKVQAIEAANLLWDLRDYSAGEQIRANRYEDNEELRYSMRSLEQHAPWIRQIFLVTNGQIPGWLNLDNPRLTLVTHDEIFKNKSHLPSFSSPAIESHLHEIPGLSDKFIYLNDDVMFGKDVWPDDFYTHSTGQKIYLTWPVPNCQDGCPQSWIKDGYCDKACNNSECEWDGGDCAGGGNQVGWGAGAWGQGDNEEQYCNSGCANNWLADRYCDQSCNVLQCGFDAGDCGVDHFKQLYELKLDRAVTQYTLPPGEVMGYFNVSTFLGSDGKIEDGSFDESSVIRSVAIAQKFKVISVILHKGHTARNLNFSITAELGESAPLMFNFSLSVNTNATKEVVKVEERSSEQKEEDEKGDKVQEVALEDLQVFEPVPHLLQGPKTVKVSSGVVKQVNLSHYVLPDDIEQRLSVLKLQLQEGDLTAKGFEKQQTLLWDEYYDRLQSEGKQPEKATPKPHQNEQEQAQDIPHDAQEIGENQPNLNLNVEARDQNDNVPIYNANLHDDMGDDKFENPVVHNFGENNPQFVQADDIRQQNIQYPGIQQQYVQNPQPLAGQPLPNLDENVDQPFVVPQDSLQNVQPVDNLQGVQQNVQNPNVQGVQQNAYDPNVQGVQQNAYDPNVQVAQQNAYDPNVQGVQQNAYDPNVQGVQNVALQENMNGQDVQQNMNLQGLPQNDIPGIQDNADAQFAQQNADLQDAPENENQFDAEDIHKSRKLNGLVDNTGFLPWEKAGVFDALQEKREQLERQALYASPVRKSRDLLDKYSDSLRFVNKLYNSEYGYSARSVPAHMPHMIDRNIMAELQGKFPKEWEATSSHKIRHSLDMQFSFSYFYYVMSEPNHFSAEDVFFAMDTDSSGILSDREIRTLATRVYELPLDLEKLTGLENMLTNCSKHLPPENLPESQQLEEYYDKSMPQVTSKLFSNCGPMVQLVKKNFHAGTKYKYELMKDDEIAFKMIKTNVSSVVGQLDDIRRNPKKFICLNDDIDHSAAEAKTTKAVLQDFYESLFPVPSPFELPREYRNRFLHINELRQWRKYRDWLKLWTQVALVLLILFTLSSFFSDKIEAFKRRYLGRRFGFRPVTEPSTLQTV